MSQKRIAKVKEPSSRLQTLLNLFSPQEYADLQHNPLEGIDISLVSDSDIYKWQVQLAGPKDSPYSVSSPLTPSNSIQMSQSLFCNLRAELLYFPLHFPRTTLSSLRPSTSKPKSTTRT